MYIYIQYYLQIPTRIMGNYLNLNYFFVLEPSHVHPASKLSVPNCHPGEGSNINPDVCSPLKNSLKTYMC